VKQIVCGMVLVLGAGALVSACGSNNAIRVGGAPEVGVRNCINAAARELKLPVSTSIAADRGTSPRDGVYAINLKVGPQARSAVCTVDENGAVLGVVFKRPE